MIYALVNGERRTAAPELRGAAAVCPLCEAPVRAYCGEQLVRHWKHVAVGDCDPDWRPGTSPWHLDWQAAFGEQFRERIIARLGVKHRADVQLSNGHIIEFQNTSITSETIARREDFYGDYMTWVFNGTEAFAQGRFKIHGDGTFTWRAARSTILRCNRPVFLDLDGENLLLLTGLDTYGHSDGISVSRYRDGTGTMYTRRQFIRHVFSGEQLAAPSHDWVYVAPQQVPSYRPQDPDHCKTSRPAPVSTRPVAGIENHTVATDFCAGCGYFHYTKGYHRQDCTA